MNKRIVYDVIAKQISEENIEETSFDIPIEFEIKMLKKNLADTDYQALKCAEGQITPEEYESIKIQRQLWRKRINELEALEV